MKQQIFQKAFTCLSILLLLTTHGFAELSLNQLFSHNAVFQRDKSVKIWGKANPSQRITVQFNGQSIHGISDDNGAWSISLDPMKANSTPQTLTVSTESNTLSANNILIGEVWLCSGQSNMAFPLGWLTKDAREKKYQPIVEVIKETIATANDPLLRHITVTRNVSALTEQSKFKGSWDSVSPSVNDQISATAYFYAKNLRAKLNVPVGIIISAWGGTRVEPWIPMNTYQNENISAYYEREINLVKKQSSHYSPEKAKQQYEKKMNEWKEAKAKAEKEGKPFKIRKPKTTQSPLQSNRVPSTLYNGMIAPLAPYTLRGVIWYQGESNAKHENLSYQKHFSSMIQGWRDTWQNPNMPFYWCQLAKFRNIEKDPIDVDPWVNVMHQQLKTMSLPHTGMAVLNDIGEAKDIHPHNKMEAGERLANWALYQTYGMKDITPSGPLYKSHRIQNSKFIVMFDHVGSGLMVGDKPLLGPPKPSESSLTFFQIKGKDGIWKWATANIISQNEIEVFHPEINQPTEVRYAWAPNAEGANLYNKEGLPASLFKATH